MKLPDKKSEIDLSFNKQKIGIIGNPGVGKSEFFSHDAKAFFFDAEGGLNFLKVNKLPIRSWGDVREVYALLKDAELSGKFPYDIIVLDPIDKIVDYAEEEIVARGKEFYGNIKDEINIIGDIPNGGGWSKTRTLVMSFIDKLEQLPCAVAFISHVQNKRIDEGGRKYDKSTITLWKGMAHDILAWPDHLLHVESTMMGDKLRRIVYTKPTQSRECKSRGGIVPDSWSWDDDMKSNYVFFRQLFK